MNKITSLQNPLVKQIVHLRERKERDSSGLFLIEGYREIKRALENGVSLEVLTVCPELFLGSNESQLIELAKTKKAEIYDLSLPAFTKISYRDRPDGLLAIGKQMLWELSDLKIDASKAPFFIIAESIEKPGNLGTILRSADAVAADAVIVCDRCTDIYNPNVVRASVGTLFTRPVIEATSEATFQFLKNHKIQIVATTPHATDLFTQIDLKVPLAIVVGTEQLGLSDKWLHAAHKKARIPMMGSADSLNVATATTIMLYEVLRQRASL